MPSKVTGPARNRRHRQRLRAAGFTQVLLTVPVPFKARLAAYAADLRAEWDGGRDPLTPDLFAAPDGPAHD